jgi:hypothetical protein
MMLVLRTTRCLVGSLKCLSEVIHQILSMCSVKAVRIMVPTVSLRWQASAAVLQLCIYQQRIDT